LLKNYNLEKVAYGLDEIMLLNISPSNAFDDDFCSVIENITKNCFIPITIGGKINSEKAAEKYLRAGADKILINNLNFIKPNITQNIIKTYGSQTVMACINYKFQVAKYCVFLSSGITEYNKSILNYLKFLLQL
jgi:imidazole glycerol-phosphate synthase subunit HisF